MRQISTVISAGLLAGLLDIIDAFVFFGARGVKLIRIPQSIASGLMGDAAYSGGWTTFAAGLGLHFAIAVVMAFVFYLIASAVPLVRKALTVSGLVYGLGCWGVMTYLVLPMSRFKGGHNPHFPPEMGPQLYNALFAHMVLVGLTIAWVTRGALKKA
ncbi:MULTISPECIES: hypothetical protein [Asticcacaulis]|uniref:hypothetical protein n=1 Tax=Asticcacaulis TaxID=76890 RepID=UPI001AE6DFB6|nr:MULTISPECIES: hypothetical protein [Asticcacaulis]MBP2161390.1 putative membrane protein YagU involved in acid resistance [Asticcacaulis solisilvae]MDR6802435.1 putative membrane protein YagU involved in acid resistance [Asticcacaulis sp. BE141]